MKTNWLAVAGCAVVLFVPNPAGALTGTDLYQSCRAQKNSMGDAMCLAYVRGFTDGIMAGSTVGEKFPSQYCPPAAGISAIQSRLIIEKYLRDNPQELHTEAGLLVLSALLQAFPCKR